MNSLQCFLGISRIQLKLKKNNIFWNGLGFYWRKHVLCKSAIFGLQQVVQFIWYRVKSIGMLAGVTEHQDDTAIWINLEYIHFHKFIPSMYRFRGNKDKSMCCQMKPVRIAALYM